MVETNSNHSGLDSLARILEHDPVKQKIRSNLGKTNLFSDLNKDEIELLAGLMKSYRAEKGDAIFVEGERAGYLCVVIDGHLEIIKDSGTGKSRKINDVPAGKLIGEMSLIDGLPHSATAVASQPTLLAALMEEDLDRIIGEYPVLGVKVYRKIAEIVSLRLRKISGELANYLG